MFCGKCHKLLPQRLRTTIYNDAEHKDQECIICFEEFVDGSELTFLPCLHGFDHACIADWLARSDECPVCKTKITEQSLSMQ